MNTRDPDYRNDPPMPLLSHLSALRDALVFAIVSWLLCATVCGVFSSRIFCWLESPLAGEAVKAGASQLAARGPVDGISLALDISFWGGTAASFPFLAFAVLRFVFPALTRREKSTILTILVLGTGLFVSGVYLAYSKTLPVMLATFKAINEWIGIESNFYFAADYMPVILKTLFAFGLVFQIPLAIFVLGWFGIVSSAALRAKRRIVIILAFIIGMLLTPPDAVSQIIMAVPLCLLYEMAIWLVWFKEKSSLGGKGA